MDGMDGSHIGQRSSKSTSGSNNGPAPAFAKKKRKDIFRIRILYGRERDM